MLPPLAVPINPPKLKPAAFCRTAPIACEFATLTWPDDPISPPTVEMPVVVPDAQLSVRLELFSDRTKLPNSPPTYDWPVTLPIAKVRAMMALSTDPISPPTFVPPVVSPDAQLSVSWGTPFAGTKLPNRPPTFD